MPLILLSALMLPVLMSASASAHHPDRRCDPVVPRRDCIGPIGNRLPPGHRRVYNRPTYWGGRIAYKIAPSSQEAMAWHAAEHRGLYDCDAGRVVPTYFYPKPWQSIRVGPRPDTQSRFETESKFDKSEPPLLDDEPSLVPEPLAPVIEATQDALDESLGNGELLDESLGDGELLDDPDAVDDAMEQPEDIDATLPALRPVGHRTIFLGSPN